MNKTPERIVPPVCSRVIHRVSHFNNTKDKTTQQIVKMDRKRRSCRSLASCTERQWSRMSLSAVSLMCFSLVTRATAFVATNVIDAAAPSADYTMLYFREFNDNNGLSFEIPLKTEFSSLKTLSTQNAVSSIFPEETSTRLPLWLRQSKGYTAESNLNTLKRIMLRSSLSQKEANTVADAIRTAAEGDSQKIAGAAEFCRILVETMEVGVTALVAAAFHFCAGVSARTYCLDNDIPALVSFWDNYVQSGIDEMKNFDHNVKDVVINAASLKRIELITLSILQNQPGSKVAPRLSRTELLNVRSLLLSETKDWRALAIRLAACLYRLRGILEASKEQEKPSFTSEDIYSAREALHVFAPLASRLGMHRVKNEIEGLAFRILYHRQHSFVSNFAHTQVQFPVPRRHGIIAQSESLFQSVTTGDEMKKVMRKVTDELTNILHQDPALSMYAQSVRVTARVKEPFSLWKKMLRKRVTKIDEIPDAIALRVVIDGKKGHSEEAEEVTDARERAICYYVQKICSDAFKPLKDGKLKDYISYPKPNGYQSLHYTACTESSGFKWPFEIQIRSGKMHQVAEFGLASHWEYEEQCRVKTGQSNKSKDESRFKLDHSSASYLRSVQEWHWQQAQASATRRLSSPLYSLGTASVHLREECLTPYLNALVAEQSDLTREQVFVFLPSQCGERSTKGSNKGRIIALPAGSCIIDALRESNYYHSLRNYDQLKLTQKLRNGDILAIPQPSDSNLNM